MTPASDEDIEAEQRALGSRSILELLGSLLWATSTRPDIQYYVSFLCQFMQKPRLAHYDAGLAILSYLNHTKHLGLRYTATPLATLISRSTPTPLGAATRVTSVVMLSSLEELSSLLARSASGL